MFRVLRRLTLLVPAGHCPDSEVSEMASEMPPRRQHRSQIAFTTGSTQPVFAGQIAMREPSMATFL